MIPLEQKRDVTSSGVEGSASFEISMDNAAHIMTILRDTLYSDKVLAVLREYGANAWDANRDAGRSKVPITVTLPTFGDPTLKIRDNGPGLTMEAVFQVYNQYGSSTKRDSNSAVGMLGIGSKSGFAYSDSFTIVSWCDGHRATYVAVIDDSEKGRVDLLDVQKMSVENGQNPLETGVEIQIPVKPSDINEFTTKAQALFAYFEPRPDINTKLPDIKTGTEFPGLGRIVETSGARYSYSSEWIAVMGCIPYKINLSQLKGLSSSATILSGILWFDVGTLQFSASREELKYSDLTKQRLAERINVIVDAYIQHLLTGIDKLNAWERRLRIKHIKSMRLSVPNTLRDWEDNYVAFKKRPEFILKSRNYRDKVTNSDGFQIADDIRLVFRDDKRMLTGYELKQTDFVVDPVIDSKAAYKAFKEHLVDLKIDGITVINISSLPWARPASAPRQVDSARARASCLTLNVAALKADKKSERWTPVVRTPLDTDVFVILNSYVPDGYHGSSVDFYEVFEQDRKLLESAVIGGKMPTIVGYRETAATPVDRAKIKGTPYKEWRIDKFAELLMQNKDVANAVYSRTWLSVSANGTMDYHVDKVGKDTPIGIFMTKVIDGHKRHGSVRYDVHPAVSRAWNSYSSKLNVAEKEWKKLVELYPMLAVVSMSIQIFSGGNSQAWIDYINMVDTHRKMSLINEKTKEGKEAA
jgi:hypothetical protein